MVRNIIVAFVVLVCCCNIPEEELDVGIELPLGVKYVDTVLHLVLVKPNEFKPGRLVEYKKILYNVCVDSQLVVRYISTFDNRFISPENCRIGETYSKVKSKSIREFYIPGYGYESLLPSSWHAVFLDSIVINTSTISDTSVVQSFFKRDVNL